MLPNQSVAPPSPGANLRCRCTSGTDHSHPAWRGLQASSEEWTTGFVIGAGTAHMLTQNISIRSETLYYNLTDETLTLARAGDQVSYRFKNDGWISRVGVNVRFREL
ncbi:hypothetical protein J4G37_33030 [Microvirga sp. 3-52]|nr:hypothetical protein [Microvirga sp. 3-52]